MCIRDSSFVCRYENILNHIDKTKHIFIHNQFFKSKHKTKYKNVDLLTWGPNVGVILVRNTSWSLNFFKNVWNKKKYLAVKFIFQVQQLQLLPLKKTQRILL